MMLASQSRWSPSIKLEPDSDDEENEIIDEIMEEQDELDDALIESEIEPGFMLNSMQRALRSKTKLVELHDEGAAFFGRQPVITFMTDDCEVSVKKVTLLWWLTAEGKRISSDRVYRFLNSEKTPQSDEVHCGDYAFMEFKGAIWITLIVSFKFYNGKRYHGDKYNVQNPKSIERVAALCTFFKQEENEIIPTALPQRYLDMKGFKGFISLNRDLLTGKLTMSKASNMTDA